MLKIVKSGIKMTDFERKILALVSRIPLGKITTYKLLAQKIGNKNSVRAVGNALHKNPNLVKIPCHRVVRTNGEIGNYRLGLAKKVKLLQNEGISIKGRKIMDLNFYLYRLN